MTSIWQPLPRRRRHPSRRRRAGRDRLGQGHGRADARRLPDGNRVSDLEAAGAARRPSKSARRASPPPPPCSTPATRRSVLMLYAWCRHCDDVVDGQELGFTAPRPVEDAPARLAALYAQTRAPMPGETMPIRLRRLPGSGAAATPDPRALRLRPPGRLRHGRRRRAATRPSTTRCATATTWPAWSGLMMASIMGTKPDALGCSTAPATWAWPSS
jgi:phytoene synthase